MADIVDKKTRSRIMSRIKGGNTKPELFLRSELHRLGFRFRVHCKSLPGKPDVVLPKYKVVIFVNGCFWHKHDCDLFQWPKSNSKFWKEKINGNHARDLRVQQELNELGWHVLVVWECAMKKKNDAQWASFALRIANWIQADVKRIRRKYFS